ncbi:phosphotyrosine protein phosphatase [Citromicrobium bathyomarinum]|uniref:low molecular weight protein tyrosine phosphatase family protein n=1 Tax=Sphingomonadales TaxID=204457 RepID=UPI000C40CE21|nr:phosphotyrosine protein phosphatase [Citromicrobium sp.]MBO80574.1 phosphotyrosine protein phosphatase [Citromicrobium sp.]
MAGRNYLFVCSQNRLRSPTAEQVFCETPGINALSAGTNNDAENPLSDELVEWADVIFAMENTHRNKLRKKHKAALKDTRVIVLNIPDDYALMDPELIRLLKARMWKWLPTH